MLKLDAENTKIFEFNVNPIDFIKTEDKNSPKWKNFKWRQYFTKNTLIDFADSCCDVGSYISGDYYIDEAFDWDIIEDSLLGYKYSYWNNLCDDGIGYDDLCERDKSFIMFLSKL